MPADAEFDDVMPFQRLHNACTPELPDDPSFRGIRIAAPRRVPLQGKPDGRGNFARAVVCGAMHMDSNYLGAAENFLPFLKLVAVNGRTHQAHAGTVPGIPDR